MPTTKNIIIFVIAVVGDFLSVLLNVTNINIDSSIFTDPAFKKLRDSTIVISQEGNQGRPNPFAPIGVDVIPPAASAVPPASTGEPADPASSTSGSATPPSSATTGTSTSSTTPTPPASAATEETKTPPAAPVKP